MQLNVQVLNIYLQFWQTYAPVLPNPYKDTQPYTISETLSDPYQLKPCSYSLQRSFSACVVIVVYY